MVVVRSSRSSTPYHAQRVALFWRGTMMPRRSGAPLKPGPLSLVLLPTNLKSILRQYRGEERTGDGACQEGGTATDGPDTAGDSQGVRGRTLHGASRLIGRPGQVEVPAELRAYVSSHGFWKWGNTTMFDIRIVNLGVGSYLRMTPERGLAKAEK